MNIETIKAAVKNLLYMRNLLIPKKLLDGLSCRILVDQLYYYSVCINISWV